VPLFKDRIKYRPRMIPVDLRPWSEFPAYVRELTVLERLGIETYAETHTGAETMARSVACALCEEDGTPLCAPEEDLRPQIGTALLKKLHDDVLEVCGVVKKNGGDSDDGEDEAPASKNLGDVPSSSSSTPSPSPSGSGTSFNSPLT